MIEFELKALQPRSYRATTIHSDEHPNIEDAINRNFTSMQPGTRLVGDITYLRTDQGWLYLAVVLDLATRMIIGWPGAMFHSDRGAQYASGEFAKYCHRSRITPSMGRTGVCWDNAAAQEFLCHAKKRHVLPILIHNTSTGKICRG